MAEDDKNSTGVLNPPEPAGNSSGPTGNAGGKQPLEENPDSSPNSPGAGQNQGAEDEAGPGSVPGLREIYLTRIYHGRDSNIVFFNLASNASQKDAGKYEVVVNGRSKVTIEGTGLNAYNQVILKIGPTIFNPVHLKVSQYAISFQVANFDKMLGKQGSRIYLEFHSQTEPDASGKLVGRFLYYLPKEEESDESGSSAAGDNEKDVEGKLGKVKGPGVTELILGAAGDTIGGIAGALADGNEDKKFEPQKATVGSPPPLEKDGQGAGFGGSGGGEPQEADVGGQARVVLPQNTQQAAELLGEHIDKNPHIIPDQGVRQEVLSALSGGGQVEQRLQKLSGEARTTLQGSVSAQVSGQGGARGQQLQSASNIINQQVSSSASATATASGGSATGELKTTAEISQQRAAGLAQGGQEISSGAVSEAQTGSASQVGATVQAASAGGAGSAQSDQSAKAQADLKQNSNTVGEYIYNKPGLITDKKTRDEVTLALSLGDLNSLSVEAKASLSQTLNFLAQGKDAQAGAKVRVAAQGLINASVTGKTQAPQRADAGPPKTLQMPAGKTAPGQPIPKPIVTGTIIKSVPKTAGKKAPGAESFGLKPPVGLNVMGRKDAELNLSLKGQLSGAEISEQEETGGGEIEEEGHTDEAGGPPPGILPKGILSEEPVEEGPDEGQDGSSQAKKVPEPEEEAPKTKKPTEPKKQSSQPRPKQKPEQKLEQPSRRLDSANKKPEPGSQRPQQPEHERPKGPEGPQPGESFKMPQQPEEGEVEGGQAPEAGAEEAGEGAAGEAAGVEAAEGAAAAAPAVAEGVEAGAAVGGPPGALVGGAAAVLASGAGQEVVGQVTSKLWWWGFGFSAGTLFMGFDFMAGAAIMDVYWWHHRKDPKLFPMAAWQKIVTVIANLLPPILVIFFIGFVIAVGCSTGPVGPNSVTGYRGTYVGIIIGDDCKYFNISSISGNTGTSGTSSTPSNTTPTASPVPVVPRGPTP